MVDLSGLSVVDGHCHPLLDNPWAISAQAFSNLLSEGRPSTMAAHIRHTSCFRRALRDLARLFGTEPAVEAVLERRRQLGPEAARHGLAESRVTALLVDTGYPPGAMSLSEMRTALPCTIHEVFRIESCAQDLLPRGLSYDKFVETLREEVRGATRRAVALKSIIAYRSGLAIRPWKPEEAARAYREAVARVQAGGSPRLTEKPLLDTLVAVVLDVCRETGRPLQLHAGFGDPDIDLLQANPVLLRPVLEDPQWAGVRIVVLHMAYPYVREAAFMASVWPQLYVDLSLALPFLGPGAIPALAEMLALAPTSKLLYGSDLGGLPELYALSADWGRAALGEALGWLIERDGITAREGREIGSQILSENARTLYGLEA
jgi:predicted TIM-barrel fold metal-dependent hydrolase/antitoxin component HigA of HigAB toxin-antitoxin module